MRLSLTQLLAAIAVASLQMNAVLASVYPTHPYSKTKFFSGKPAVITWKDDSRIPHLKDMSPMNIELWNNSNYITTLAKNIHTKARSHTVSIPSGLTTGSHYALIFNITDPPCTIWSADFTIISEAQDYLFPARPIVNSTSSASASSTFDPATAPTAVHTNPLGASPGSPYRGGGDGSSKKGTAMKLFDTTQLRLQSILVPALVGILMTM